MVQTTKNSTQKLLFIISEMYLIVEVIFNQLKFELLYKDYI